MLNSWGESPTGNRTCTLVSRSVGSPFQPSSTLCGSPYLVRLKPFSYIQYRLLLKKYVLNVYLVLAEFDCGSWFGVPLHQVDDQIERPLAHAVDLLDRLPVVPGQFHVLVVGRADVDRVHDGMLEVVVQKTEHVTDLVDGDLEKVNSGEDVHGGDVLDEVLVGVKVDVSSRPRMS